jgi:hypothetical protein
MRLLGYDNLQQQKRDSKKTESCKFIYHWNN